MTAPRAADPCLTINPAFAELLRAHKLDSLAALMTVTGDTDLAKPGLSGWRHRTTLDVGGQRLFIKRYQRPPIDEQLTARLHGFRAVAETEWHWMHRLRELTIPVPQPVAFGYERQGGRERQSVLVTAAVPGRSLEQWMRLADEDEAEWLHDRAYRDALLTAIAQLVRRLHEAGLFHRDLYLSHIFLDPKRPPSEGLSLIDLQRIVGTLAAPSAMGGQRLVRIELFHATRAGFKHRRLRWFKRYRQIKRLSPADKSLIRWVVFKTRFIARHDRRKKKLNPLP